MAFLMISSIGCFSNQSYSTNQLLKGQEENNEENIITNFVVSGILRMNAGHTREIYHLYYYLDDFHWETNINSSPQYVQIILPNNGFIPLNKMIEARGDLHLFSNMQNSNSLNSACLFADSLRQIE